MECSPVDAIADHDVTGSNPIGPQHVVGLDDADTGGRDVVRVGRHQPGVLGGLPAEQCTSGLHATLRDARAQCGDPLRHDATDGDVVLQQQRLGATHHDVVHHHRDEVDADGVVLVHRLSDRDLGPDAVGRGGQHRLAITALQGEQPGETAQPADHFGPAGLLRQRLEQFDRPITRLDIHPGRGVREPAEVGLSPARLLTGC